MLKSFKPAEVFPPLTIRLVGVLCLLLAAAVADAETLTLGEATVTVPKGWIHARTEGGRVTMVPGDLAEGVVCSLMLLGGEAFEGSVMDRLAADWAAVNSDARIVHDDKGRLDGAGQAVQIASRSGTVKTADGAELHLWMVLVHPRRRIERMVFVANTREAFEKYVPAAAALINGMKFAPVAQPAAPADEPAAGSAFGHMRYVVPRGWTEKKFSDGVILSLQKPPANEVLEMLLMTPKPAAGTLQKALATAWDDVCVQLRLTKKRTWDNTDFDAGLPRRSPKGWEHIRGRGHVLANDNERVFDLDVFVVKVNDRFERIAVYSLLRPHNLDRYSLYRNSTEHRHAVLDFVLAMKFDDFKESAIEPASTKGDGIVGVWQGIAMFGGQLKHAYAIFYTNGQVFFGSRFPFGGCDGQNTWVEAEETPGYWGTYTFQNDSGALKMVYGDVPIRRQGDRLIITPNKLDHKFIRVDRVDGAKFNGTYALGEVVDGKLPAIAFAPDGRFQDSGAMKILEHEYNNAFAVVQTPGAGTYVVRDYTITFRYTDGRVYRLAFPGMGYEPGNQSPPTLTLSYNLDELKRQ
jgi:hypothetical protein